MAGLVFLKTMDMNNILNFYKQKIDMKTWLIQPDIEILSHDNLLIGFHKHEKIDKDGMITFFYNTREEVDIMYEKLKEVAESAPKENKKYKIYNFFAKDPEGRNIEIQSFLHPIKNAGFEWR